MLGLSFSRFFLLSLFFFYFLASHFIASQWIIYSCYTFYDICFYLSRLIPYSYLLMSLISAPFSLFAFTPWSMHSDWSPFNQVQEGVIHTQTWGPSYQDLGQKIEEALRGWRHSKFYLYPTSLHSLSFHCHSFDPSSILLLFIHISLILASRPSPEYRDACLWSDMPGGCSYCECVGVRSVLV